MRTHTSRLALLAVLLPLFTGGCGYNTLQTLDEQVNKAEADIQTQLQRRADLVPNLVATVKGVAAQESTIYVGVAEARSRLTGAIQGGNIEEMAAANSAMGGALTRLLAVAEAYPEL
ncbi:MAG: LemA family protein, partial [Gemmatimonadetes bacterium]|nr:LemA family protein [Gemmatimonadota bacterium]